MADAGFPVDEYTPHGYLANPFAVAHSWSEGEGGCLRTSREDIGFGWQLPWALRAQAGLDLVVTLGDGRARVLRRAHFEGAGLHSPHHSANLFVYRWDWLGRTWEAAYTLVEQDVLGLQVTWRPWSDAAAAESAPEQTEPRQTRLTIGLVGWRRALLLGDRDLPSAGALGIPCPSLISGADGWIELGAPYGRCDLYVDDGGFGHGGVAAGQPLLDPPSDGGATAEREWRATITAAIEVGDAPTGSVSAVARRVTGSPHPGPLPEGEGVVLPLSRARRGDEGEQVTTAIAQAREADDAFWRGATHLAGDWPVTWRRGWVYDTETTRMCVYPPGGIFTDVWPAWMVQWPRAVVAEGTLDMARFAYASPELAQRALLSLFRDAEAPNVPCVFQHGEPNMVAADGSICGTSPAWCVPFYNLERLFSLTLDRAWLAAIYPHLKAYLEWWLAERSDPDGWAVYKCTWEAGEDDTPRLDPERRGDNVVSALVRPVELQAMMALSAGVMWRFALALGETDDQARWRNLESEYLARTRQLWDADELRFRDWDARNNRFLSPAGEANYWAIDPCRYSALAFTPLLAGLLDDETRAGLRAELQDYDGPPWTLWASWSYVVLEAAPSTGDHTFAGRVAAGIVGRVYDELDARQIADPRHPTPGVAREYWPLDLDTWASCEGYGWGANTASLLVRQVFGFVEGLYFDESNNYQGLPVVDDAARAAGWRAPSLIFDLWPSLPDTFLVPGREYWLTNLPYRGARLSLGYRVAASGQDADAEPGALRLLISANVPTSARVVEAGTQHEQVSDGASTRHELSGRNGEVYTVVLRPGP